jgi:hypothetical protein
MSLKDLESAGVTLPPDQWGKQAVRSTVNKPGFLSSAGGAVAAAALMLIGQGELTTWLGAVLFLLSLFLATVVSFRAVRPERAATLRRKPQATDVCD